MAPNSCRLLELALDALDDLGKEIEPHCVITFLAALIGLPQEL
jgi:hypothetical protein